MIISKLPYIPVYVATLLLSAFLLFLIQPIFGKMVLPLLGGTSSVWNTAMLFFQITLLAGYAYAHGMAKFIGIRAQILIHILLLTIFTLILPIAVPDGWSPPANENPTLWQLMLMTIAVGGPFFMLSANAPLLQHWFSHTKHQNSDNPYFLYAASNLGSISALLVYPFFVEPALSLTEQSLSWSWGTIFVFISALLVWKHGALIKTKEIKDDKNTEIITWKRRIRWLILAFIPSSLMLGVTTFITTDLASAPLLWIVPLALYVGTFIIAFSNKPLIDRESTIYIQGLIIVALLSVMMTTASTDKPLLIIIHLTLFFFTALLCHHELSATRPTTKHLTQFYLLMSLGGALGGAFNAIIAPHIFIVPIEYTIVLILGCFIRGINDPAQSFQTAWCHFRNKLKEKNFLNTSKIIYVIIVFLVSIAAFYFDNIRSLEITLTLVLLIVLTINLDKRWIFGLCCLITLTFNPPGFFWGHAMFDEIIHTDRNFFGVIRVMDSNKMNARVLLHGTTIHGTQALTAEHKHIQLSYYSRKSGFADVFEMIDRPGTQKIAAIGLGVGVISCYQEEGRNFDFFEINPNVIKIAENPELFTYLSDCGSPYNIILGDARLKLQGKPNSYYDIIIIDAFSSDSIPIHLITREAFELYQTKLNKNGYLVVHISNHHLNLKPVVANAANFINMNAYYKITPGGNIEGFSFYATELMVLTNESEHINHLKKHDWEKIEPANNFRLWTDQYSNAVSALRIFQ